ncbi:hypothetical protein Trydic_g13752 [Trypoxylus dichotomus]
MSDEAHIRYIEQTYKAPHDMKYLLIDFAVDYLRFKPENIIEFAADYFELLKDQRDTEAEKAKQSQLVTFSTASTSNVPVFDDTAYMIEGEG